MQVHTSVPHLPRRLKTARRMVDKISIGQESKRTRTLAIGMPPLLERIFNWSFRAPTRGALASGGQRDQPFNTSGGVLV